MTILISDSFDDLVDTAALSGRTLDNDLGGTLSAVWLAAASQFIGSGGKVSFGDAGARTAVAIGAQSGTIKTRVLFEPVTATTNNLFLFGENVSDDAFEDECIALLLAGDLSSLRVSSMSGGSRTDHASVGITAPTTPFWIELEVNKATKQVTSRVLNFDTTVRNTVSHTFTTLPASGTYWGFAGYFGNIEGKYDSFIVDVVGADTFASDDFTGVGDGVSISGRTLNNGLGGSGSRSFVSNGSTALVGDGTGALEGSGTAWANVVPGQANYRASFKFDPLGDTSAIQLTGRKNVASGNASYYGLRLAPGHTALVLWEGDGTTGTPPFGTSRATQALAAPNTPIRLQADFNGETVTGRVIRVSDNSVLATVTHTYAAGLTGTYLAFGFADGGGVGQIDDLVLENLPTGGADTTPPSLTDASAEATGPGTAVGSVTSSEAGPGFAVVTFTPDTPTAEQIEAGNDHENGTAPAADSATLVAGVNADVFNFAGLSPGGVYYMHVTAKDTVTPTPNVATPVTFGTFEQPPPPVPNATTVLYHEDGTTPVASVTGLRWAWWDTAIPDFANAADVSGFGASTDASGVFSVELTGSALGIGDTGTLLVYKTDGVPESLDTLVFCGPLNTVA